MNNHENILSPAKLEANRRNARKSTGPRTPAGRAQSRMNALKRGILAEHVLVDSARFSECGHDFVDLHKRLWRELLPAGALEEILVEQIVTCRWRLQRALAAESGEIGLAELKSAPKELDVAKLTQQWRMRPDPIAAMQESAVGNCLLEMWLAELTQSVERHGELTAEAVQQLAKQLGGSPNALTNSLEAVRLAALANPDGLDAAAHLVRRKSLALEFLRGESARYGRQLADCEAREMAGEKSRQAAARLPSAEALEKITGYEARLNRQMYRAMLQLERLQRARRGEAVPPPVSLEVHE